MLQIGGGCMEFFKVVEKRTSVRAYLEKPLEEEKLLKILRAASLAPSAGNLQAYRMVLVRQKKLKKALADASHGQEFMAQAPVLVAFLSDRERSAGKYGKRGAELYCVQDATIAAAYLQLAAAALGVGSVWVGGFEQGEVDALLGAGKHESCVAIIPLGYAAEEEEGHERRKLESMVCEI